MILASPVGRLAKRFVFAGALVLSLAAPAAAQQNAAQLAVQIQEMQEQIRLLTGQVEGLQFQLTQMQTLLERQNEDNEFRFQQLEGGAGGKTEAATPTGGVTPSGALPQTPAPQDTAPVTSAPSTDVPEGGVVPLPGELEIDPTFEGGEGAPMDDLGSSGDPLVGTGQGETGVPLGTRPLDLSLGQGVPAANGDAAAQYQAGYDAIVRGDYAFAEEQFRQFISLYPEDQNAADATNWLGEALLQRGAYDEAADVLLTGFQKFPDSARAPDLLMKLGVSLAGAGERETACRTLDEVGKRYTNLSPAFLSRLADEKSKAQCPA